MRKVSGLRWLRLFVLWSAVCVQLVRCDRDACDLDDPTLKKLCRKVESQEKYQEKWVATNFKAETVFRWYNSNKDWLNAPRLARMMKRLLKRASALNPTESDDFADEQPVEQPPPASAASPELELKLEQMAAQLAAMAVQLNQTRQQLKQLQDEKSNSAADGLNALEVRLNATLSAHHEAENKNGDHLQRVEQMASRLSRTEKAVQTLKNNYQHLQNNSCTCPAVTAAGVDSSSPTDEASRTAKAGSQVEFGLNQKFQWDMERELEQLKLKLELTASDMDKSLHAIQMSSEGALRNFSSVYHEGMKSLATVLEDKLSAASTSSYEVITNATMAFGEDLQSLRQTVSSSAAQIQFLVAQDMKTVRGLEELRSGTRRHENNIQVLTNGLNDFKLQVQDQLNNVRAHFSQSVAEYYQKIAERQSAMGYHISSIKDELATVKGKVRNIPLPTTATGNDPPVDNDDDLLLTPPSLDSR